MLKAIPV